MADQWTWYRAAIEAKHAGKDLPPVSDGKPEWGFFYAKASRAGGRVPVCIYADKNGDLVARSGTKENHQFEDAARRWAWVAGNPVARDDYVFAWNQEKWPDGTPTTAVEAAPAMGDNLPTDPFERLLAEVTDKTASATAFLNDAAAAPDKPRADKARNLQAELLALNKSANTMHETEKEPHLKAGRAVDAKFKFRATVEDICVRLRKVFENIMKAEEARQIAEAERKFQAERAAAEKERKRIEADRAKLREDDPITYHTSDPEPLPELPLAPEPVKVNAGGGIGRAAGLKDVYTGEIVDYTACLKHYGNNLKVREIIEKLVAADVKLHKMDARIPGVNVKRDRRAA